MRDDRWASAPRDERLANTKQNIGEGHENIYINIRQETMTNFHRLMKTKKRKVK
jgi:hypothetical protein